MENVVTIRLDEVEKNKNVDPVDREKYSVSPYARWFNEKSPAWTKDPEANRFYLLRQQVVGWIFNPENPTGDNYVDFGLFRHYNENFINGCENSILLDPNVDGMILDQI